jgi:hypothetical protein
VLLNRVLREILTLKRGRREQEGEGGIMRGFMIGPHDFTG